MGLGALWLGPTGGVPEEGTVKLKLKDEQP